MKSRFFVVRLAIVITTFCAVSAQAVASEVLANTVGLVVGQQSFAETFDISGPGTLTVSLSNIDWPQQLASLNLVATSTAGLLGPEMGAGTDTFAVNGGPITLQWFGAAQGSQDVGVYGMNVQFQAEGGTGGVVPLPTSIALLLSGLVMVALQRRMRSTATPSE